MARFSRRRDSQAHFLADSAGEHLRRFCSLDHRSSARARSPHLSSIRKRQYLSPRARRCAWHSWKPLLMRCPPCVTRVDEVCVSHFSRATEIQRSKPPLRHGLRYDGSYYWIIRLNTQDAASRGIGDGDLVRAYNDRGSVILAARLTERIRSGTGALLRVVRRLTAAGHARGVPRRRRLRQHPDAEAVHHANVSRTGVQLLPGRGREVGRGRLTRVRLGGWSWNRPLTWVDSDSCRAGGLAPGGRHPGAAGATDDSGP